VAARKQKQSHRRMSAQVAADEDYQLRYEVAAGTGVAKEPAVVCVRLPPAARRKHRTSHLQAAPATVPAITEGERDPQVLAALGQGKMRNDKLPALAEALSGMRFGPEHAHAASSSPSGRRTPPELAAPLTAYRRHQAPGPRPATGPSRHLPENRSRQTAEVVISWSDPVLRSEWCAADLRLRA
jgi:hypothetical protein